MGSHSQIIRRPREIAGCRDRLSSLPNHILLNILSLLPFRYVVATSILSHQWRYLWTRITSFNVVLYKNELGLLCYDEKFKLLTSPSIFTLQISLNRIFSKENRSILNSWVLDVCARNVKIIKVCTRSMSNWKLPMCVFQTKSLVELAMKNTTSFDFPSVVNLPNLKKLYIKGSTDTGSIILFEKFINSCPSLEELYFELDVHVVLITELNFIMHSMKRLDIKLYNIRGNIVIDAPNLEYFAISGPTKFRFVEIPNALLETQLRYYWKYNILVSNFVESISHSVRYLTSDCVPLIRPLERLSYLTCLGLELKNIEFGMLKKVLEVSPNLKVLRLKLYSNSNDDWMWKDGPPAEFEMNMNIIEFEIDIGDEFLIWNEKYVLKMIEYLVKIAGKDLKQLTLMIKCWWENILSLKKDFVECLINVKEMRHYEIDVKAPNCWSFVGWF